MSFTVNFDGLFNENTNIIQMSSTSSLNKSTPIVVREPTSGQYYTADSSTYLWKKGTYTSNLFWNGVFVGSALISASSAVIGGYTYYRGSLYLDGRYGIYRTYNSSTNTPVTIADSTDTEGSPLTGGTAVTETVTETQKGQTSDSGTPVKHGLVVKENGVELTTAAYLPPATSGQEAIANVSGEKVITATSTDLTVEAFGLSVDHGLASEETSVSVEEVE